MILEPDRGIIENRQLSCIFVISLMISEIIQHIALGNLATRIAQASQPLLFDNLRSQNMRLRLSYRVSTRLDKLYGCL